MGQNKINSRGGNKTQNGNAFYNKGNAATKTKTMPSRRGGAAGGVPSRRGRGGGRGRGGTTRGGRGGGTPGRNHRGNTIAKRNSNVGGNTQSAQLAKKRLLQAKKTLQMAIREATKITVNTPI